MIALPLDPSLTLVALSEPRPQIKDQKSGEVSVDTLTGQPLYQIDAALSVPGGRPMTFQLTVLANGLSEVPLYAPFHAVGLTFMTGEKNGRTWQIYKALGITPLHTANGKTAS